MVKNAKYLVKIAFEKLKSAFLKSTQIRNTQQTIVLTKLRKKQYRKRLAELRARLRARRAKRVLARSQRSSLFFKYGQQNKLRLLAPIPEPREPLARRFANRK
jgi:hypothetical protein